jgi:hypothetical protein
MLASEDVGVHMHTFQTTNEPFQLGECGNCRPVKLHRTSEITSWSWDVPDYRTYSRTPLQKFGYEG